MATLTEAQRRRNKRAAQRHRAMQQTSVPTDLGLNERTELLCHAINAGAAGTVRSFLTASPGAFDLFTRVEALDGATVLGLAAMRGNQEALIMLLDQGADGNRRDTHEYTPLMHACWHGHTACARTLMLTPSVNPDLALPDGRTALMLAAERGHVSIVHELVALGARIDLVNAAGQTVTEIARDSNKPLVVNAISTALHIRNTSSYPAIVRRFHTSRFAVEPMRLKELRATAQKHGILDALRRRAAIKQARRSIKEMHAASIVIQKVFRGRLARRQCVAAQVAARFTAPALLLQRLVRGKRIRCEYARVKALLALVKRQEQLLGELARLACGSDQSAACCALIGEYAQLEMAIGNSGVVAAKHAFADVLQRLVLERAGLAPLVHLAYAAGHTAFVAAALASDPSLAVCETPGSGSLLAKILARDDLATLELLLYTQAPELETEEEQKEPAEAAKKPSSITSFYLPRPQRLLRASYALHQACRAGATACLTRLLEFDPAAARVAGPNQLLPLSVACRHRHLKAARALLAAADLRIVNLADPLNGHTALHYCSSRLLVTLCAELAQAKADVNALTPDTRLSPLALAAQAAAAASRKGEAAALQITDLLLAHGAQPQSSDDTQGAVPLLLAGQAGLHALAARLMAGGAKLEAREPKTGNSLWHMCCMTGDTAMLQLLADGLVAATKQALEVQDFARAEQLTDMSMGMMAPNFAKELPMDLALRHTQLDAMLFCFGRGCQMPVRWLVALVQNLREHESVWLALYSEAQCQQLLALAIDTTLKSVGRLLDMPEKYTLEKADVVSELLELCFAAPNAAKPAAAAAAPPSSSAIAAALAAHGACIMLHPRLPTFLRYIVTAHLNTKATCNQGVRLFSAIPWELLDTASPVFDQIAFTQVTQLVCELKASKSITLALKNMCKRAAPAIVSWIAKRVCEKLVQQLQNQADKSVVQFAFLLAFRCLREDRTEIANLLQTGGILPLAEAAQIDLTISVDDRRTASRFLIELFPAKARDCAICCSKMELCQYVSIENTKGHWRKNGCQHVYCGDCLESWISTRVAENFTHIRCPCPECRTVLYLDDVQRLAPGSTATQFEQLLIAQQQRRLEQSKAELGKNPNMRLCPHCYAIIERSHGCDSMSCVCGHQFNWNQAVQATA